MNLNSSSLTSTLVSLLRERSGQAPDREYYVFLRNGEEVENKLRASELDLRARAIAAWLQSRGATGKTVLLAYPAGLEFATAFFGCLYAGAIGVPAYIPGSRRDTNRLAAIVQDSQARLALTGASHRLADKFPQVEWVKSEALPSSLAGDWKEPAITSDSLAYLQYTSGSTQSPRGVMITHSNILANLRQIDEGFHHTPDSICVSWLPHFHDMGLVYGLLQPLYANFQCIMMSPNSFIQRPVRWLRAISSYQATHSGAPNFAYELCIRRVGEADRREIDLSSWRVAFNGAEPVRAETLARFAEAFSGCGFRRNAFYPSYGLAEATLKVTSPDGAQQPVIGTFSSSLLKQNRAVETDGAGETVTRLVGCGLPGCQTSVVIADVSAGRECGPGEIGEILVSGPAVAAGYWRRAEESDRIFRCQLKGREGEQFLLTGDLGVIHRDQLFVTGRLKEMVIIRGQNYYPQDLERTVEESHPALRAGSGAAFAIEVEGQERLAIAYELARGHQSPVEAVASAIRCAVANEHGLTVYAVILLKPGGIPKTSSGKVQRYLCRDAFVSGNLKAVLVSLLDPELPDVISKDGWLTRTVLLEADPSDRSELVGLYLAAKLANSLGGEPEGFDASRPAVAYGVDSLAAAAIKSAIETDLGVNLPIEDLLGETSLFELTNKIVELLDSPDPAGRTGAIPARHSSAPGLLPCSFEQERLWLLDQLVPGYTAHNVMVGLRLSGDVREALLVRCLRSASRRHDALRMRFSMRAGVPIQIADVAGPLPVSVLDLMAIDGDGRDAIAAIARCEARRPFHLDMGPLARAIIIRISADLRVLLLTVHHIIADGYSLGILLRETLECYRAAAAGQEPKLPDPSYQYADFVQWSREQNPARVEAGWAYWRTRLANLPPSLCLLEDRQKLASAPLACSQEVFFIGKALSEQLRALSRRSGTTLFMTLAAAFAALLHRLGGQEDIVFGCPTAGRFRPEFDEVVGQFAYPLVFRVQVEAELRCEDLLRRIRGVALAAYQHSATPFAKMVELAAPERRDGFNPLFRAMIGLLRSPVREITAPDICVTLEDLPAANSDCDIFLTLLEEEEGLRGLWTYNESLFDVATIRMLIDSFQLILEQVTGDPNRRVGELGLSHELETKREERRPLVRAVALAATFMANPIEDAFRFWVEETGSPIEVHFAPYDQVFQELLDPGSMFFRNQRGANVILVRFEDWTRSKPGAVKGESGEAAKELERNASDLVAALGAASGRSKVPLLICLCSDLSADGGPGFAQAAATIIDGVQAIPGVHVLTSDEIERLYPVSQKYDPYGDLVGHVPLTMAYLVAIATAIVRRMVALELPPIKVIVADCDQTLWKGVCGEDGPERVECSGQHLLLQRFLVSKRQQGMLLCLCSKNNPEDVTEVFARHPEMPLHAADITAFRINWKSKSENLQSLAAELNLGLDAFVFIDDDPVECAEVSAHCPQVLTVQLPSSPGQTAFLLDHLWALDAVGRTDEDGLRAAFHLQNAERQRLASASATLEEYLAGLALEIEISTPPPDRLGRVAQLTQRTSQFNLNGRRWEEAELVFSCMSGAIECLAVDLQDRFGRYGLVGAILYRQDADTMIVENLVLSCRALGRRVEHAMISYIGEAAARRGVSVIELKTLQTARNLPAREFLNGVAKQFATPDRSGCLYRISVSEARAIKQTPLPGSPPDDLASPAEAPAAPSDAASAGRRKMIQIARDFDGVEKILAAMSRRRATRASSRPYTAPRSITEQVMAGIWSDVLGVEPVGIDDDFFELGGHSLRASQVVARIQEFFKIAFPLKLFFTTVPTIAELSRQVEELELEAFGAEAAALLAEADSLSDQEIAERLSKG